MSEYWVSKKQYWCKYCDIWVRDDAPSKRLHESGMKHQGNKERFIRNLYKGGERAKRDKEAEARQMERIEAAARASHSANDGGSYSGRPIIDRPVASTSKPRRDKPSGDKWSNYSTADQLGLAAEEAPSSYEIEQMVRGRGTSVGKWEEVVATPTPPPTGFVEETKVEQTEEEEMANFKFQHRDKRPLRDVYDDDDVDTTALLGIKLKSKERKVGEVDVKGEDGVKEEKGGAGFSKGGWGKAETAKVEVKEEVEVKVEAAADEALAEVKAEPGVEDKKPSLDASPAPPAAAQAAAAEQPASSGASMFKKRRPPPSSRKK